MELLKNQESLEKSYMKRISRRCYQLASVNYISVGEK